MLPQRALQLFRACQALAILQASVAQISPTAPVTMTGPISPPMSISPWRGKVLLCSEILQDDWGAGRNSSGVVFLLLDPNRMSLVMFGADMGLFSSTPCGASILDWTGRAILTLRATQMFTAHTVTGYALSCLTPLQQPVFEALSSYSSGFTVRVWSCGDSGAPLEHASAKLLSARESSQALPSLLLPSALLAGQQDIALQLSFSFSLTVNASLNITSRGPGTPAQAVHDLFGPLTTGHAFVAALKGAYATMARGMGVVPGGQTTTVLTSFLTATLPAIPPLTTTLPAVNNGQLLSAGAAAISATMVAYAGFLPPLDSPVVLAAITRALDAAILAQNGCSKHTAG